MNNIRILKEWLSFSKPSKKWFYVDLIAILVAETFLAISPIFSAKAIVCINNSEWFAAGINIGLVFLFLVVSYAFWQISYSFYNRLVESIYSRINMQMVEKMLNAKQSNFVKNSKEKLLNIIHTDVFNIADSVDRLAVCIGRIYMLAITVVVIFTINVWVGFAIIVCGILNFLLLNWLETIRSKRVKITREDQDEQYSLFSQIIDTRKTVGDFNMQNTVKKRYNRYLNKYIGDLGKKSNADAYVNLWFEVFYRFLIFVLTIGAVVLCSQGNLSIEAYFIIVTYVTTGIETTNKVFDFIPYLKNTEIYVKRINSVLEFKEYPKIPTGTNKVNDIVGYVDFEDVSYLGDKENPSLKNVSFRIAPRRTTVIYGDRSSGKRTIFHLMHRQIASSSGQVTLDGVNILEFDNKVFIQNFNYVSTKPQFFNDTILNNLKSVCKDENRINEMLAFVGIDKYIESLPLKMETLANVLPEEKQYFLSIARMLLTTAEVIAFYEIPSFLTKEEQGKLNRMIFALQGVKTVVVFTSAEMFVANADKVITVKDGEVANISVGNNEFIGFNDN